MSWFRCNQTQALRDDHFASIDSSFNIPLSNKDDSSRQFHLDVHMSIPAGLYKLYYIRRTNKSKYIVLGGLFPLQIQFINSHEISFSSPSLKQVESFSKKPFKDITNVKVSQFQQSNHTESSQDEGKHCVAFNNLTPKFKQ